MNELESRQKMTRTALLARAGALTSAVISDRLPVSRPSPRKKSLINGRSYSPYHPSG